MPFELPDGEMPQGVACFVAKMANTANGNDAILRQPLKTIAERIGIAKRSDGDDGEAAFLHIGSRHPVLKDTLFVLMMRQVDPKSQHMALSDANAPQKSKAREPHNL